MPTAVNGASSSTAGARKLKSSLTIIPNVTGTVAITTASTDSANVNRSGDGSASPNEEDEAAGVLGERGPSHARSYIETGQLIDWDGFGRRRIRGNGESAVPSIPEN